MISIKKGIKIVKSLMELGLTKKKAVAEVKRTYNLTAEQVSIIKKEVAEDSSTTGN